MKISFVCSDTSPGPCPEYGKVGSTESHTAKDRLMQPDAESIITGVTALHPLWVNVFESARLGEDGLLLYVAPCPAVDAGPGSPSRRRRDPCMARKSVRRRDAGSCTETRRRPRSDP